MAEFGMIFTQQCMHNPSLLCSPLLSSPLLPSPNQEEDVRHPERHILQILQRIPAGSLIRLRWACKYWLDLITRDDDFIKMHLLHHHSTRNSIISTVSGHSVLISKKDDDTEKLFKSYLNYNTGEAKASYASSQVRSVFPFKPRHFFNVLGSCNGLILLHTSARLQEKTTPTNPSEAKLIIWNPCTNEYKAIPNSPIVRSRMLSYGLGYDNTFNDYKVIRIIYNFDRRGYDIQVYTLGTDSWKSIVDSFEYRPFLSLSNGVFANGALYWLNPSFDTILSLDIVTEKLQEVPISKSSESALSFIQLRVIEGSLYYTVVYTDEVEIWIMNKDYDGVNIDECSWTKLYTYLHDQPYKFHKEYYSYRLLRFTKSGEILMLTNDKDLCLCSPNNHRVETIRPICDPYCSVKEVYTESLVSLKTGTYLYESRIKRNIDQKQQEEEEDHHLRKKKKKDHLQA